MGGVAREGGKCEEGGKKKCEEGGKKGGPG